MLFADQGESFLAKDDRRSSRYGQGGSGQHAGHGERPVDSLWSSDSPCFDCGAVFSVVLRFENVKKRNMIDVIGSPEGLTRAEKKSVDGDGARSWRRRRRRAGESKCTSWARCSLMRE